MTLPYVSIGFILESKRLIAKQLGLYGRKSDPEAKVIPKPNHVCKTAKLIPKWAKLIPP